MAVHQDDRALASTPHPDSHKCDLPTLDYSRVKAGRIECSRAQGGCGRVWRLVALDGGRAHVWEPDPRPVGGRR